MAWADGGDEILESASRSRRRIRAEVPFSTMPLDVPAPAGREAATTLRFAIGDSTGTHLQSGCRIMPAGGDAGPSPCQEARLAAAGQHGRSRE